LLLSIFFFNNTGVGFEMFRRRISPAAGLKSLPALASGQSNFKRNFVLG
jgi:hypothetical protein